MSPRATLTRSTLYGLVVGLAIASGCSGEDDSAPQPGGGAGGAVGGAGASAGGVGGTGGSHAGAGGTGGGTAITSCEGGTEHVASSCGQGDVQSAIDLASPGDTVRVPAGDCAWGTTDQIRPTGICLLGAGEDGSGTNITVDAQRMVSAYSHPTHLTRVSGFRFRAGSGSGRGMVTVNLHEGGGATSGLAHAPARIDHLYFEEQWTGSEYKYSGVVHINSSYGLVDHCTFHDAGKEVMYVTSKDAATWTTDPGPVAFGGPDFTFVEDNVWIMTHDDSACHAIMGDDSGKYVFRHNSIEGKLNIDAHGYCSSSADEGSTRAYEIYANAITVSDLGSGQPNIANLRGSTGFFYDNQITIASGAALNRMVQFLEYQMQYCVTTCAAVGPCNTYPCPQQIGWDLLEGGNRNDPGDFFLRPVRIWSNTVTGGTPALGFVSTKDAGDACTTDTLTTSDNVQADREWIYSTDPSAAPDGYTAYPYPHPLQG